MNIRATGWPARGGRAAEPGLAGVLSVRPRVGPSFGAVVGAAGGVSALLAWELPPAWLATRGTIETMLDNLATLLAGPGVGFVLRWRAPSPDTIAHGWRRVVETSPLTMARAEVLAAIEASAAAWEPTGLVWLGLVVGADDPSRLGARVAAILQQTPGMTRTLSVPETIAWARDWAGDPTPPSLNRDDEPAVGKTLGLPRPRISEAGLVVGGERGVRLWRVMELPSMIEVGWVRHLLQTAARTGQEFDLALWCAPVADPDEERHSIEAELVRVERRLARAARAGWSPRSVACTSAAVDRAELLRRLAALDEPGKRLRLVTLTLATRGPATTHDRLGGPLVDLMRHLGFGVDEVRHPGGLERAWRACGPLPGQSMSEEEGFRLPATEAAALAAWGLGGVPGEHEAVGARSAEGMPARGLTAWAGRRLLVATGEDSHEMSVGLQGAAVLAALRGVPIIALHRDAAWLDLTAAIGGVTALLGPHGDAGLEPLSVTGHALDTDHGWRAWLAEGLGWLAHAAPPVDGATLEDVRAAMVELGLSWLERQAPPTLTALQRRLHDGGHTAATATVAGVLDRRGWLDRSPARLAVQPGMTTIGWAGPDEGDWPLALAVLVRRLWRTWPAGAEGLVIVDASPRVLAHGLASTALLELARRAPALGLGCWAVAGPAAQLARSAAGRALLTAAPDRATWHDSTATARDLEDGLGWSPALASLIGHLPPGMALLRLNGTVELARSIVGPLLAALAARGSTTLASHPTTASA